MSAFTNFLHLAGDDVGSVNSPLTTVWPMALYKNPASFLVYALVLYGLFDLSVTFWKATKSPLSNIPGPWYAKFTTLHLKYYFATGKIWKFVRRNHREYGKIMRLGPRHIWIADKQAIKQILSTIDLPKVTMYAEISHDRFSPGLFGEIRIEPHKRLKRFLAPAFTVLYVDKLEQFFSTCVGDLIQRLETTISPKQTSGFKEPVVIDMLDLLHNLALDIMGECSFGQGFGQTNPKKHEALGEAEKLWRTIPHSILGGMSKRYQNVYVKRFFRSLGISFNYNWPAEMVQAIDLVVQKRRTRSDLARPDILQHFIDEGERPDTGIKMTTGEIVDQMSELLLAGSETTSVAIACLFMMLVKHPDCLKKVRDSLPVLGPGDPILDSKLIRSDPQYDYLNACIKETLRLFPIASEMGRRTGKQWVTLLGHHLPPGTVVSASYRELMRDPEFWPEPERFIPSRWLEDSDICSELGPSLDAFYPFSAGRHSCIGINFAWSEMRMVAANLLARYNFSELPGQNIDFRQFITMQYVGATWSVYIDRRSAGGVS